MNLSRYEQAADEAIELAMNTLNSEYSTDTITWKGKRDYSTNLDYAIERKLKDLLLNLCPETRFLGEEESADTELKGYVWVLDPIDGTINFSRGSPLFGVSLALTLDGEAIVSRVVFPDLKRRYEAAKGKGAFCNGQSIRVSDTPTLSESVISTGDFAVRGDIAVRNRQRLKLIEHLSRTCLRVRMLGTAALDLCFVADGTHDASIMLSNNAWDVQGGVLIVREAGGYVYDADGNDHSVSSRQTMCSGAALKPHIIRIGRDAVCGS